MRVFALVLMLAVGGASAAAQQEGTSHAVFTMPPVSAGCPVAFSVERKDNSGLVETKTPGAPLGQGLRIHFEPKQAALVSATIKVHGFPLSGRVMPAASGATSDDATETFELTANGAALVQSSIWTKAMGAVSYVELTRATYADGKTWQASKGTRCSAAPSPLVLVGAGLK
jgi:hypothetical protein